MASERVLIAARDGDYQALRSLKLSSPTTLETRDSSGANALNYAARNGHLACVKWLIEDCNFDVCTRTMNGSTIVHDVAGSGQLSCLKYLVRIRKISLDRPDQNGITPLHLAARFGHVDIVQFLVEEKSCSPFCESCSGITPIHCAAVSGNMQCLVVLLGQPVIPRNVNIQANDGTTPLYHASQAGQLACVQFLVQNGADTCLGTGSGCSPIHAAAQNGNLQCLVWLVEYGSVSVTTADRYGATPAHFAAAQGHVDILRWLNEKNAVKETDLLGGTPLHDAAEHGQIECLHYLLDCGVDLQAKDRDGLTALDLAERSVHRKCSDFLKIYLSKVHLKSKAKVGVEMNQTEENMKTIGEKHSETKPLTAKFTSRPFTLNLNNKKQLPPPVKPKSSPAFVEVKGHYKNQPVSPILSPCQEFKPADKESSKKKDSPVSPSSSEPSRPVSLFSTDSIMSSRPTSIISSDSTLTYVTDNVSFSSYEDLVIPPPPVDTYLTPGPGDSQKPPELLSAPLLYPQILVPPPTVPRLDLSYQSDHLTSSSDVSPLPVVGPPVQDMSGYISTMNIDLNYSSPVRVQSLTNCNDTGNDFSNDSGIAFHSSEHSMKSQYGVATETDYSLPFIPAPDCSSLILPSEGTIRDKVRKQQNCSVQSVFSLSLNPEYKEKRDNMVHNQADILNILQDLDNTLLDEADNGHLSKQMQADQEIFSSNFYQPDDVYQRHLYNGPSSVIDSTQRNYSNVSSTSDPPLIDSDPPDQILLPPPMEFDGTSEDRLETYPVSEREKGSIEHNVVKKAPTHFQSPRALPSNLMAEIKAMHQSPVPLRSTTNTITKQQKSPGFSPAPCPTWKKNIIHKKLVKKQEEEAEAQQKKAEEEAKWAGIPEWKRQILQKREEGKLKEIHEKQEQKIQEEKKWEGLSEWQKKALQRQEKQKLEQAKKGRTKESPAKVAQKKLPLWKQAILERDSCVS